MQLDPALLDILACPSDDHAPLRLLHADDGDGRSHRSRVHGLPTRYPIRDGIPILLVDEAEPGPNGIGVSAA